MKTKYIRNSLLQLRLLNYFKDYVTVTALSGRCPQTDSIIQ